MPGENIIGYKQSYDMLFIGVIGNYRIGKFEVGGLAKFSDWVNSDDHDNHYKTGMIYETKGEDARYYSYELNLAYYFVPEANVFINGRLYLSLTQGCISDGQPHLIYCVAGRKYCYPLKFKMRRAAFTACSESISIRGDCKTQACQYSVTSVK